MSVYVRRSWTLEILEVCAFEDKLRPLIYLLYSKQQYQYVTVNVILKEDS